MGKSIVEARLRHEVTISEQQYGFMPRKSTTDAMFASSVDGKVQRRTERTALCFFWTRKKLMTRLEELWYCMRKSQVAEMSRLCKICMRTV